MSHIHIEENDKLLFDRIAEEYAKKDIAQSSSYPRKYQLMRAIGQTLMQVPSKRTIVEIACGLGASSKYLCDSYERYIGVDYSEKLILKAKKFYGANKKSEFIAANVKDLCENREISPHSADVVLAVGALHHMTELDRVMRSLKHIAKAGAYFVAVEPNKTNPIIQALRFFWARINQSYSKDQKYFSKKELRALLARNNFEDITLEFQGFFTPPFAQVIINPQFVSLRLAKFAVFLDKTIDRYVPEICKFVSWNIVIRAKFPAI